MSATTSEPERGEGRTSVLAAIGEASAKVLVGNTFAAALSLLSFALTARALGLHDFGLLLVAVAYTQTIGRLFGFQSWQVMIRFGPQLDRRSDTGAAAFFTLVRYAFLLDVCGAIFAAFAVLASAWTASLVFTESLPFSLMGLFAASLLCRVNGAALGVMRLADRFGALAVQTVAVALVKVALVGLAFWLGGSLTVFAGVWAICMAIEYLAVVMQAFTLLRVDGFEVKGATRFPAGVNKREFWRLHVNANLWSGAQNLRELDSLVVAVALSPASLAIYRTGRDLCLKLNRLLDPLVLVAYPYFARARASDDCAGAMRLFWGATLTAACVGVTALAAYWLVGKFVIEMLFGPEFAGAFEPGLVFMAAFAFTAFGRTAIPAAMAADRTRSGLLVTTLAIPPFLILTYALSVQAGVMGAAVAFLAYSALTSVVTVAVVAREGE